ncbi:MAG: hypothetical protein IT348_05955 [Candidatus Eisenbacteria bacterium]|nr:hypothetical protein [Candidatus Eisenbacteria bacterium]
MRRLMVGLALGLALMTSASAQTDPRTLPLVQSGDLTLVGSFTLPANDRKGAQIEYGGRALGLNEAGTELYFSCIGAWGMVRVTVPSVLDGRQASIVEDCAGPSNLSSITGDAGLGSVFWWQGTMYVTGFSYYDAGNAAAASHWKGASWATLSGPVRVSTAINPGWLGGYIGEIPAEWRPLLGGPLFLSLHSLSIISRTSSGPDFTPFDPATMKAATPLLGYGLSELAADQSVNPVWNRASRGFGAIFPRGTGSVLYLMSHGPDDYWYGPSPSPTGKTDPLNPYQGEHASRYIHQILAYKASDLADVKAGTKTANSLRPYARWEVPGLSAPGRAGQPAVAYDAAKGLVYVSQWPGAGKSGPQTVHVLKVNVGSVPPPNNQPVDCVGSYGAWTRQPNSESACSAAGSRTFIESRLFTVVTSPANGGAACPASPESRTSTEACTPPPVDVCAASPVVVSVSSWPGSAEGARSGSWSWSVAGAVSTLAEARWTYTGGRSSRLTVTDSRGCAGSAVR